MPVAGRQKLDGGFGEHRFHCCYLRLGLEGRILGLLVSAAGHDFFVVSFLLGVALFHMDSRHS